MQRGRFLNLGLAAVVGGIALIPLSISAQQPAATPGAASSPAPDPREAERNALWKQAEQLKSDGKFKEAAVAGERMLAIEIDWLGADHREVAASREWLSGVDLAAENWEAAANHAQAVLDWRTKHLDQDHYQTTDARLTLKYIQTRQGLTSRQRAKLHQADELNGQIVQLHGQGKYGESIPLGEKVNWERRLNSCDWKFSGAIISITRTASTTSRCCTTTWEITPGPSRCMHRR